MRLTNAVYLPLSGGCYSVQHAEGLNSCHLVITNNEQELIGTNYFATEMAKLGLAYLSINARAIRLLVPDALLESTLPEMLTGKYVILSRSRADDHIELLFEDDTETPYSLCLSPSQCFSLPARADSGRTDLRFLAYRSDMTIAMDVPARFRMVEHVPCLRAWK